MNHLVTGGAGFIGSAIARDLIARGETVTIIDNLNTGLESNIPNTANFICCDIRDKNALEKINLKNIHRVYHLAGQSSGEISHDDPEYDIDTNAKGTLNILKWSHERKIKRFMHASTMGLYGQVNENQCPVSESACPNPLSFYGCSKLAAEKYTNYFSTQGMNITSFRMFNVYGPGQNLENMKQGMVSIYLAMILRDSPIIVKGSKERFRDFIYIDDVVSAWRAAESNPISFGKVYNLATGIKTTVEILIQTLLIAFQKDLSTYPVTFTDGTPGDQRGIFADIETIKKDLNWVPKTTLSRGLQNIREALLGSHG